MTSDDQLGTVNTKIAWKDGDYELGDMPVGYERSKLLQVLNVRLGSLCSEFIAKSAFYGKRMDFSRFEKNRILMVCVFEAETGGMWHLITRQTRAKRHQFKNRDGLIFEFTVSSSQPSRSKDELRAVVDARLKHLARKRAP